jgi:hypothetical protein
MMTGTAAEIAKTFKTTGSGGQCWRGFCVRGGGVVLCKVALLLDLFILLGQQSAGNNEQNMSAVCHE